MTELLPLKAKRRIWSLRRRGVSFSSIFRRATKDGAHGVRRNSREVGKNEKQKDMAHGVRRISRAASKLVKPEILNPKPFRFHTE